MFRRGSPPHQLASIGFSLFEIPRAYNTGQRLREIFIPSPYMTTKYGLPIFLEDKSGKLSGSEFIDIHERMRFSYRCTARDATHTAYMIFNAYHRAAVVALDFGPGNTLGTISWGGVTIAMNKYLVRVSNRVRKFVGSDSQEYFWSWRTKDNQEWTCTNAKGYLVAYYSLKVPGEPPYEGSSGCSLTVDEAYGHLAAECLASLMIMRHIAEFNLQ